MSEHGIIERVGKNVEKPTAKLMGRANITTRNSQTKTMEQEAYFVFVNIPAAIEPLDRGDLFEDPLSEVLEREGLGEVTGGGTLLSAPDENGERDIESCGIDVDLYDFGKGLALLKSELKRLNIPLGTTLEFEDNGESHSVGVYE